MAGREDLLGRASKRGEQLQEVWGWGEWASWHGEGPDSPG